MKYEKRDGFSPVPFLCRMLAILKLNVKCHDIVDKKRCHNIVEFVL
jgi:hypothetical protein